MLRSLPVPRLITAVIKTTVCVMCVSRVCVCLTWFVCMWCVRFCVRVFGQCSPIFIDHKTAFVSCCFCHLSSHLCLSPYACVCVLFIVRASSRLNSCVYSCTSVESVSSQITRVGKKAESSTDNSSCSSPSAPLQGPVIYAQLDHSGSKNSFHKMEPVVYADIRKN